MDQMKIRLHRCLQGMLSPTQLQCHQHCYNFILIIGIKTLENVKYSLFSLFFSRQSKISKLTNFEPYLFAFRTQIKPNEPNKSKTETFALLREKILQSILIQTLVVTQ